MNSLEIIRAAMVSETLPDTLDSEAMEVKAQLLFESLSSLLVDYLSASRKELDCISSKAKFESLRKNGAI